MSSYYTPSSRRANNDAFIMCGICASMVCGILSVVFWGLAFGLYFQTYDVIYWYVFASLGGASLILYCLPTICAFALTPGARII